MKSKWNAVSPSRTASRALFAVLILAVLSAHVLILRDFAFDDAWISFRYARNWVNGHGLVYNIGETVEGYTNFSWVVLVGLAMKVGAEPVLFSKAMGFLLSAICTLLAWKLSHRLEWEEDNVWLQHLPPLVVVLNICWAAYAMSGMETLLYATLVTGVVLFALRARKRAEFIWLGALAALTAMTRPDGLIFAAATGLYLLLRSRDLASRRFEPFALYVVTFSLLYGTYFLWRYGYYGYLFPNTFYAKVGRSWAQSRRGLLYVLRFSTWFFWGGLFLAGPLTAVIVRKWREADFRYLLGTSVLYLLYIIYVGGDGNPLFRFMVPILPLLAVLEAYGLSLLVPLAVNALKSLTSSPRLRKGVPVLLFLAAAVGPLPPWLHYYDLAKATTRMAETLIDQGHWLRQHADPEDTIATYTAGAVAYYSGLHTYDMLGLTDEFIAHSSNPSMGEFFLAGHEKSAPEYVFSNRPTFVLVPVREEDRWVPGTNELVNLPGFLDLYEVIEFETDLGRYEVFHLASSPP